MTWVRLDDAFPTHPKVLVLSTPARWAFVVGLCYAAHYLTDGFVPAGVVKLGFARELEEVGLWTQDGAGWRIHDYLDYQPSKQEVASLLNKRRAAGKASGRARAGAHVEQGVLGEGMGGTGGSAVQDESAREGVRFEEFYAAFPTARKGARRVVRTAFTKALSRADADTIIAATIRYRDDPNREDQYTVGAAKWLNNDMWEDGPIPARNGHGRGTGPARTLALAAKARERGE